MKKLVATFLLLIFTSNIATFACENVSPIASTPVFTPVDVKKEEESKTQINIEKFDKQNPDIVKYHNKFEKYSRKKHSNFNKTDINSVLKGYKYYNYPEKDNLKNVIRIELKDGDYAVLDNSIKGNKKYKYAAEYHKDGSLMGIVQIKTIKKTRKSVTLAFYEYRLSENNKYFVNNYLMFMDIEKNKKLLPPKVVQFIYSKMVDLDSLVCCQIDDDLYLNDNGKNLIVALEDFEYPKASNDAEKSVVKTVTCGSVKMVSNGVDFVIDTTKSIIVLPFAAVGLVVGVPLLFWLFYEINNSIGH